MSSSYTAGTRIALDITDVRMLNSQTLEKIIREIKSRCGSDIPLSKHLIETDSESWGSVKDYDPFFEDVDCVKSLPVFWIKSSKADFYLDWMSRNIYLQKESAPIFRWKS